MVKLLSVTVCSVLIAGSIALIDHRSISFARLNHTRQPAAAPTQIYASGIVEGKTEDVELRMEASGRVVEVLVSAGDWVDGGQVLVRLDDRAEQEAATSRLANLHLAEANLERLVNGARDSERQEARALLAARRSRLDQAEMTWQRIKSLRAQGAIAQQEADDQSSSVQTLTAEVAAASARLEQIEAPARDDEVRAARARIAAAKADLELAQIALDKTTLRAPSRAQVLDVGVEVGELVGPERREPVMVLADTSQLRVRAYVEEIDAPRIVVGATAKITADGLPDQVFAGVVRTISPQMKTKTLSTDRPDELYDAKVREILLDVADSDRPGRLIFGLRVDVVLDADRQNDGSRVPLATPSGAASTIE